MAKSDLKKLGQDVAWQDVTRGNTIVGSGTTREFNTGDWTNVAPVIDEEKCKHLIAATAVNQDNHSAWLIHVKNVEGKSGEDVLSNEELTARCNAINIIPQSVAETDAGNLRRDEKTPRKGKGTWREDG